MNNQTRSKIVSALRAAATLLSAAETLSDLFVRISPNLDERRYYKYNRTFDGDQHYFLPREQLKNGGVRGLIVVETLRGRLPKQAKIGIVDKRDLRNFDLIPRAELNPAVADRFDEWFLNNSWKVKPTSASSKASDFGFSEREVFYPLAKAKKLAEEARKGDPDWTYKVTPPEGNQRGLAKVVVFDEDGEEIGSL